MEINSIALVIFTCEGRENLLRKTLKSFNEKKGFNFSKTILAIDGTIFPEIIAEVNPNLIVQNPTRKGYPSNIINAVRQIDTEYFFWLEDDWKFDKELKINYLQNLLSANPDLVQIVYSKTGALKQQEKLNHLSVDIYKNHYGFSANPCLVKTSHLRAGLEALLIAKKGGVLGQDGFENYLTRYFDSNQLVCAIQDPTDGQVIIHEGYLESTPRNWHMTNSIENRTKKHMLTMTKPSFLKKIMMLIKLLFTFFKLSIIQFYNSKVYEYCFRIIATSKSALKDE